ncbi:Acetylornithine aminotransferase [Candidatus Sulfotelmatobacter kueseliae]|uniref:Acetylornithine aminotransferase n=1 Tax=Candidatus Sulfotelmatobacter kueseliae TaxID=2042962 RepID=A0A2U3KIE3_9BACT|nr:Acetylornithine aminotransferase [Candidatus Sulfotelmatobacter kueseliae]
MATFEEIAEREQQFLLQTYNRYPVVLARGKGVFVYDIEGKRYLDFVSGLGVNALGHAHPRIVKAIREQAAKLLHVSNLYYHEYQGRLAEKLCQLSGGSSGMSRVFFSNSGTEAIEGSIKLARLAGHRAGGAAKCRLVALEGSYHGRTFGALSLTGQDKHRKGFEPLLEDVTFVKQNDVEGLRAAVNDNTCAIVLEPIFGEGGIYECSGEFLGECRALADRHRAALIFDEIQCGLGRTGTIFAFQNFGVTPDMVAIAKPLAAGLPLGAFLAKEEFASAIGPGQHGTTFGGGPLTCRIALEFLAIVEEEKLLENVNRVGGYLRQELEGLVKKCPAAKEVRGRGFIQGIQLEIPARPIVDAGLAEGVLFNSTQDTVVRFLPPFLLEEKHVDKGIRVLKKLLGKKRRAAA